ncbi:MAG: hypothetical protein JNL50_00175 [Phycisphaerae bacterium]|nr:hypothetical protein [Phycisphaerae bacterium]
MDDEAQSRRPDPVLDPLLRALTLAKFQLVIGFLLMLGAPIAGAAGIGLAWSWSVDNFQGLLKAGVINAEALAAYDNGAFAGDWINAAEYIVHEPLNRLLRLFEWIGIASLAWFAMGAVTCWQLRKARRALEAQRECAPA